MTASTLPIWYNTGKTNTKYVFEWDQLVTISGEYILNPCVECSAPIMEVFIHPLNPFYLTLDEGTLIGINVSLTTGPLVTPYSVSFTVTHINTGVKTVNGGNFPIITYRGVGFRFYGLGIGASITLFNPTITDPLSRAECTTRVVPTWYEPKFRIQSTVPFRKAIITEADQVFFPGKNIGECGCDLSTAGRSCQCPSGISKYGLGLSCRGFGDEGKATQTPDGVIRVSGTDSESGCVIYTGDKGKKYSECNTVPLGTALFTLLVPGAVFDYPSIYIESLPLHGASIFQILSTSSQIPKPLTVSDVSLDCLVDGMLLPYFHTGDELNQLTLTSQNVLPIVMGMNITGSSSSVWAWNSVPDLSASYFIFNSSGMYMSSSGTCFFHICTIVNFNNYAYFGSLSVGGDSFIKDGDTLTIGSTTGGTLTWNELSTLRVIVYVFKAVDDSGFITCVSGPACVYIRVNPDSYFDCRCPTRVLNYLGGHTISEIQIFNYNDKIRSTSYRYISP